MLHKRGNVVATIGAVALLAIVAVACGAAGVNTTSNQPPAPNTAVPNATTPPTVSIQAMPTAVVDHGMGGMNMGGGATTMPAYDAKDPAKSEQMFLSDMIAHHQGAVDMSKLAASQANHAEVKQLAQNIITSQQKEIGQQTGWLKTWYSMAPMQSAMAPMMLDDVKQLQGLQGDAFDKKYLELMIPHHQSAIDMAKAIQPIATHPELKQLTNDIITSQTSEIDQMQQWLKTWYAM